MPVIAEVREAVGLLAKLVEDTRTLLAALEDGRKYLQAKHPDAAGRVADVLEQMRFTVAGTVSVTRVVLDFDFSLGGSADDKSELARFNNHLIAAGKDIATKDADVSRLRGSCERIRALQWELQERAGNRPWWALLGDKAGQQADQLSKTMERLYLNDDAMATQVTKVLEAGDAALQAVREALRGSDVGPRVEHIPVAQQVLREQADEFAPVIKDLKTLRDRFSDEIRALDAPAP
jgi:poly-gamma-glutamate capsule biosynthesis protein CapA/YwtB (metallophosphatase superfamily)